MRPTEQIAYVRRYFELMSASKIEDIINLFEADAYVE